MSEANVNPEVNPSPSPSLSLSSSSLSLSPSIVSSSLELDSSLLALPPSPYRLSLDHIPRANEWFHKELKSPQYVVAPMVNQSELAFRMLTRKYGASLCYTPMIHSANFSKSSTYRDIEWNNDNLEPVLDRPLFAQFCGHDPLILKQAVDYMVNGPNPPSAIDLNFGCPQGIARKGHYGSFLLGYPEIIRSLVRTLADAFGEKIHITCKMRILPDLQKTLFIARLIEASGASLLTVHGRTKEQNKDLVGPNDFEVIAAIKNVLKIPVIANGGISNLIDVHQALNKTKTNGVMTSEAILHNPALFTGEDICPLTLATEYLELARKYKSNSSAIRGHLFKICYRHLTVYTDLRSRLGSCNESEFEEILKQIKIRHFETQTPQELQLFQNTPNWYFRHRGGSKKEKEKLLKNEETSQSNNDQTSHKKSKKNKKSNQIHNQNDQSQSSLSLGTSANASSQDNTITESETFRKQLLEKEILNEDEGPQKVTELELESNRQIKRIHLSSDQS